jgi:branched-chain amino acid transport system permease protein
MRRSNGLIVGLVILVALAVLPFATPASYLNYVAGIMCFVAIYGALAMGMGVIMEQAGVFSLAHPAMFGIGAYITGILAVAGVPPLLATLLAAAGVAALAFLIGSPMLRLKGYYLACATFALLLVADITIPQLGSLTGGHDGLLNIPPFSIGGVVLEGDKAFYFLTWGLCLATYWFLRNLMNSRVGRAIKSLNDSEVAAKSVGIDVASYRLRLFILTAILASLMGSLFCFYIRYLSALMFGFPLLIELTTMMIVGGGKTLWGPLLGGFIILWIREAMHLYLGKLLPAMTATVDATFFGIIIIVILIFMPGGLAGWAEQIANAARRMHTGKTAPADRDIVEGNQ